MEKGNYKAIFIDWNGTLSTDRFWEQLSQPSHPHHHIFSQVEQALFKNPQSSHLFRSWMTGEFTVEDVMSLVGNQTNIPTDLLIRELEVSCKTMQLVSPNILNLVKEIREKEVKVVIATDNMDTFNRWTVPTLKLNETFDAILNSYDIRALKKDPLSSGRSPFFSNFLDSHNIHPTETIIIDDSHDKDGVLQGLGINYRKIEFGKGLEEELQKILDDLLSPRT